MGDCARIVPVKLSGAIAEIGIACDVVAIEHGSSFVAADFHCDGFRNSCPHHVPDGGSPEVMTNHPDESGFLTRGAPRFSESRSC
jgi:hypothetical protein